MTDTLTVWWGHDIVGALAINKQGDTSFSYAETWLAKPAAGAISLSLPLRAEPFSRRESRPFFEGLLPEESQRAAIARTLGLSIGNEFRLLEALGGEVAGALSLWPQGERPPVAAPSTQPADSLDDGALIAILNRLPIRPMLAGETELRLSLAGAQAKLPVVVDNGHIALPAPGQASTHILKPPIERFESTTENEAFAMRLARQVGLSVAEVDYRRIRGRAFLLVERYDRIAGNGHVKRLHQEDFCQALGFPSSRKYAADGGPVLRDCFRLLCSSATPTPKTTACSIATTLSKWRRCTISWQPLPTPISARNWR